MFLGAITLCFLNFRYAQAIVDSKDHFKIPDLDLNHVINLTRFQVKIMIDLISEINECFRKTFTSDIKNTRKKMHTLVNKHYDSRVILGGHNILLQSCHTN